MCNSEKVWQIITEKRLKRKLYKDELKTVELRGWRCNLKDILHRKRNEKSTRKQVTNVSRSVKNSLKAVQSSEIKKINSPVILNNLSKNSNTKKTEKNLVVEKNIFGSKSATKMKSNTCENVNNLKVNLSTTLVKSDKKLPSINKHSTTNPSKIINCKIAEKMLKK